MYKKNIELKYCCGCGLCSHFVLGDKDQRGYYRPNEQQFPGEFDSTVCYCNQLRDNIQEGLWGMFISAYYGHACNTIVRDKASSGGVLTAIACYLINARKVDYVIQICVDRNSKMETKVVWNSSPEEVLESCGSRYSASASLVGLLDKIDLSKRYAVIGKPCDMRVLRSYMNKHLELNDSILYLLTFFCGGTPSTQANDTLLNRMGIKKQELVSFTYRGNGWPGKTVGADNKGKVFELEYEEAWGEFLGRDLQEICRFCWEGVGEAADISCGDGWYIEKCRPSFKEKPGRNIILARTEKGEQLLHELEESEVIDLEKIKDIEIMKQMQPGQYMRKSGMFSILFAMKIMGKTVPDYSLRKMLKYSKYLSLSKNIKMFGGTIKRILKGKIQ